MEYFAYLAETACRSSVQEGDGQVRKSLASAVEAYDLSVHNRGWREAVAVLSWRLSCGEPDRKGSSSISRTGSLPSGIGSSHPMSRTGCAAVGGDFFVRSPGRRCVLARPDPACWDDEEALGDILEQCRYRTALAAGDRAAAAG